MRGEIQEEGARAREGEFVTEVAAAVLEPVPMIQAERKGTLQAEQRLELVQPQAQRSQRRCS